MSSLSVCTSYEALRSEFNDLGRRSVASGPGPAQKPAPAAARIQNAA